MANRVRACVTGVLACAALALPSAALAAENPGPRVSLLSSGTRASIVIELDGDGAKATAIEATDNQSVAVEIGPVQGKVANQRLKAAAGSSLVDEVRVRGVTQGTDGTIITIQVFAKTPVSGSVRRAQQRVYIDLERRDAGSIAPTVDRLAVNRTGASGTTSAAGTASSSVPSAAQTAQASRATPQAAPATSANTTLKPVPTPAPRTVKATPPPAPTLPAPAPGAPAARPSPAVATGRLDGGKAVTPPAAAPRPASSEAPAVAVLPPPPPAAGTLTPSTAPSTSTPGPRPALARAPAPTTTIVTPAPAATMPASGSAAASPANPAPVTSVPAPAAAVTRTNASGGSSDDLLKQGAAFAKQSDVKGLERLKQTAIARLGPAASEADATNDPTVSQIHWYLNDARQQRLLADAQLFRSQAAAAAPKPPAAVLSPTAPDGPSGGAQSPTPTPRTVPVATRTASAPSGTITTAPTQAPDPTDAMLAQVIPDIERMRETLASWQPGYHASPTLPPQIDQLNAKLRELQPPAALASALTGLTSALTDLSSTWVPGSDGKLIPFRDDVRAVERTRTALTNFIDAAAALKLSSQR